MEAEDIQEGLQEDTREDEFIINEINAACNSLGKLDESDGTYMKDRDCKSCLKEIIRLLNKDTKRHIARQTLGSFNIIKADLIPLINQYCDFNDGDTDLFNLIMRLCTNLTASVFLLFENQEIPQDLEMYKVYNKLQRSLYSYKEAFANDNDIWKNLNVHLWHTEEEISFERLLILIRNILHIPVDSTADLGMHSDFDTHSLCLYRMEQNGLFHTIIRIASETQRGSEFCFHITEIVYLMLRDQNPTTVAMSQATNNKRKLDDDDEDRKRLAELTAREKCDRLSKSARFAPPRFKNSTFVVRNCRTIGQNNLTTNRIITANEDISFDSGKTELRKSKNKRPLSSDANSLVICDKNTKPSQVTHKLKAFSKLFVEKIYANYMQQIKHNLIQKKAAENDESYYLWAVQYFTAFNRLMCLSMDNISETMSTSTLHFIQVLISDYQDKLKIEKKRAQIEKISKRLHLALRAYREILYLIGSVKSDSEFWETVSKIKKNIFSELEYNSLLLTMIQQYDESKHCPEYLKDLISANDIFLDLFDSEPRDFSIVTRYCSPDVMKVYVAVLRDFKRNDSALNLQVLKFLKKVVYDCKCEVLLMQASVLSCFLEIVDYHNSMPGYAEFVKLTKHIMSIFGDLIGKKRWMIQELLFWKTNNDIIEIETAVDPPKQPSPKPASPENVNELSGIPSPAPSLIGSPVPSPGLSPVPSPGLSPVASLDLSPVPSPAAEERPASPPGPSSPGPMSSLLSGSDSSPEPSPLPSPDASPAPMSRLLSSPESSPPRASSAPSPELDAVLSSGPSSIPSPERDELVASVRTKQFDGNNLPLVEQDPVPPLALSPVPSPSPDLDDEILSDAPAANGEVRSDT